MNTSKHNTFVNSNLKNMRPGKMIKSKLLTDNFGEGRVSQIAQKLRLLKLFPKGGKHIAGYVTAAQAAVLLYLLASESTPRTMRVQLEILGYLNDRNGNNFFDALVDVIKNPDAVREVEISTNTSCIFAAIRYTDSRNVRYNEGIDIQVKQSCVIPGSYFKQLSALLTDTFNTAWSNPGEINQPKNPTADTLQRLADACKWDERIEVSADDLAEEMKEMKTRIQILK